MHIAERFSDLRRCVRPVISDVTDLECTLRCSRQTNQLFVHSNYGAIVMDRAKNCRIIQSANDLLSLILPHSISSKTKNQFNSNIGALSACHHGEGMRIIYNCNNSRHNCIRGCWWAFTKVARDIFANGYALDDFWQISCLSWIRPSKPIPCGSLLPQL